ncbi:MAG: hypothetical protein JXQ83_13515, partial [Candidatus Glassbacteria bacterium]|nr:hypothetical protein [Candidatus Glassbacteria bacterium]
MHGNIRKLVPLGAICLFIFQPFICPLAAQDTGRPKILVLPFETAVDRKVAETFQWDLAKALDHSGNFDIVSEKQYNGYLKAVKLDREP